jgi:flagellar biosynthesis protein FliR
VEFPVDSASLVGFCMVLVRAGAWVSICPPFNTPSIPVRVRTGFAVALSFLLAARVGQHVTDLSLMGLIGALITQLLAGFALGLIVLMIFSALQSAGEMIDLQVGFSLGGIIDPFSGNMATPIGRLHQVLGVAILFAIDGHVMVVRGFIRSVDAAPLGQMNGEALVRQLIELFGIHLSAAIEIALPVLTALFCAEVALGFLGKAAPQLNILIIGFAVKTIVAITLLTATIVLLPDTVSSLLGRSLRAASGIFTG